ncbi:MAG: threonine/serine exporter family protein [Pirellulales bacterium]
MQQQEDPGVSGDRTAVLLDFATRLGQSLLASGEQTARVELILRRAATAYGMRSSRVVAFPTVIFVNVHDGQQERQTFREGPTSGLRLDQIAEVYTLADEAERGRIEPAEGLRRLLAIQRTESRFGTLGMIFGHTILTVGVFLLLSPTSKGLLAAAILGTVVGLLKAINRDRPLLSVPLPVVASALVSGSVFVAMRYGWALDPLYLLVPPLVSFLPGAMLTLGMIELAYGDMVSGSSRLMTGIVQLVLLAFGLAVGALAAGYEVTDLVEGAPAGPVPLWWPWLGVIVFGLGAYLHFSAPRKSLPWMLLVLSVAFIAQQTAADWVGYRGSGFFGMLAAMPLGYLIQLRFGGPPAVITFLPSFWLLVPGALGLLSVKQMLGDRAAGLDGVVTTVFVFASIALGTLMGASIYKWITETFGWWKLQLGRIGSYWAQNRQRKRTNRRRRAKREDA